MHLNRATIATLATAAIAMAGMTGIANASTADGKHCGKVYRVDIGAWIKVDQQWIASYKPLRCKVVRRVARNVGDGTQTPQGSRIAGRTWHFQTEGVGSLGYGQYYVSGPYVVFVKFLRFAS